MWLREVCTLVVGLLFCGAPGLAFQDPSSAQAISSNEQFRTLQDQLQVKSDDDLKRYTPEFRDRLTRQVKALLVRHIVDSLNHDEKDMAALRQTLSKLDPRHMDDEYSQAPYVFQTKIQGEPVVVTGFLLLRGGSGSYDTKVIVQAFRRNTSGWQCVAETGDDLDHHELFMKELPSQRAGEAWFLAYGMFTGANGRFVRIRGYSFDGEKFSTLWAPPMRISAEIEVKDGMITVHSVDEHQYYELRKPPYGRVEKFLLTVQGVELQSSILKE